MSSPLAVLKKKRTCLDVHRQSQGVPFRRNLLKEVTAELEPSDPSHASGASTSAPQIPPRKGAPPSNTELLSAMMKRVTLLETMVRSQAKEIKLKDQKIAALERKVPPLHESDGTDDQSARSSLEKRCEHLQNQVWEMESFLKDYGLIWVGDVGGSDPGGGSDASTPSFGVNFDLVLQRIRELNVIAGEGESFVRLTAKGAQLATKESVRLSLYRDGIVLFDGPFRSYQEHSTQQFLRDLMDGYFPSELQSRFPDGTPFEVCDRRNEEFTSRLTFPGKKVRAEQFLNRLPKVVIKNGHVIDIRNSLRDTLQGSTKTQTIPSVIINTPALRVDERGVQPASSDLFTLKIRSEDGNCVFILKMCFSETIGHLRRYLDEHRGSGLCGYDIISAHPRRCYSDESQTLGCCGFTGNSALLLRKRKR
ncbi:UBX domain-containing protein 11 isoform X1 [Takifugu flavidus]|uniref:UBX domain-containing protein 11 isoform X1 n=1 Tax=Takifugu flavidus TaxID=433684 RepID=UPI002544BCB3|nr:UBX domain-containing protein 11 isoform X1 [Takifugu flavidus]